LKQRRRISEALAIFGVILLTTDTINTFTSQDGFGFLNLTDRQSGISLGIPSIVLFLVSFGVAYGLKTKITTLLLIYGGTLLAISKIMEPTFGLNLYLAVAIPYVYTSLIAMGFILLGLGLWRLFKKL
jgi:hypothetical protein